jgi:DNA-directed RNA polymerase specialized sigma subunit
MNAQIDHLKDPQAISWMDLKEELEFTPDELQEIRKGAQELIAQSRAHRLAEVRKRQKTTQVQVAAAMGVTQARVSRIEKGAIGRSELDTVAAYVEALGGKLRIVADFGGEFYVLG